MKEFEKPIVVEEKMYETATSGICHQLEPCMPNSAK